MVVVMAVMNGGGRVDPRGGEDQRKKEVVTRRLMPVSVC